MRTKADDLRGCPTCGTPVGEIDLGLRDFNTWLNMALPGRVGATDIDAFLEQSRTGRALALEFKPQGAPLPLGQRLTLKWFVNHGADVWVAWEQKDGKVQVGAMDKTGEVLFIEEMTRARLARKVERWWKEGLDG